MEALEFTDITLTMFLLVAGVCMILLSYYVIKTLKELHRVLADIQSTTQDIKQVKESFKSGTPILLKKILIFVANFLKGGDDDEKRKSNK